ncbi:TIGR02099 family protein [Cupriavidus taiwanensis]|uniref:YhdP family protein n=1 Tax=Cupriavidus taiwanensis TaxID=164546 RepID=UPI0015740B47|nr:YhdP family protein [Cupriavidus taiwanensis]NSX15364.1 TIGR02099 family protein [Cupriavidus taiwanensis]
MSSRAPQPAHGSPPNGGAGGHEAATTLPARPTGSLGIETPETADAPRRPSAWARAAAWGRAGARAAAAGVRHPFWRGLGRALVRLVLVLAVLALAAGLLIRFVLWPQAAAAREWLEQRGSQALSAQVSIGSLETYWDGWHPAFRARGLSAIDAQQRALLSTATLDGKLAWRSLISMNLQFVSLSAAGTDILVRRTPEGRLLVAGMVVDATGGQQDDDRFLGWLMSQGRVALSDGKLRWLDEKARLPQLDIGEIRLDTRRDGARHSFHLEARSPALGPRPLEVRSTFRDDYLHSAGNWRHWAGQATWDLGQLQLPVLQRYLAIFERVASGTFSTDGSIEFRQGRIVRSQTRLRASGVDLQLAGAAAPLRLANAQALLLHRSERDGSNLLTVDTLLWQPLQAQQPAVPDDSHAPAVADGSWREGMRKVAIGWARARDGTLSQFSLKAPTLDLNTVRAVAASMPIDTAVLRKLRALQPAGHLDNLNVSWTRARAGMLERGSGKPHYSIQGTLREVSVNGQPAVPAQDAAGHARLGTPGFSRLSGTFAFDDQQGTARFEGNDAALVLPGLFEDPRLAFDQIGGDVRWQHRDGKLAVTLDNLRFANADAAGSVRGTWREGGDGKSGIADLAGEMTRATVARVPRYLPLDIPAATRHYLAGALAGGEAAGVSFVLRGDLAHFPFQAPHEKAGEFRVEVPIEHVSYQIAPHDSPQATHAAAHGTPAVAASWPVFTDIAGRVVFDRGSMTFLARRATVQDIAGVTLHDVSGRIDDLSPRGKLAIDGSATGPVQGFVRYINASPVREWTAHVADAAKASGNGELKLRLEMPLEHADAARVDGRFRFPGNDVVLHPQLPALGNASGTITFNEHGFGLENLRARFLGGELRLGGGTQPDGATRVSASGQASAAGLREAAAGTALAPLAARLEGATGYSAVIGVRERQLQLQLNTELNGMALQLPAPLAKAAAPALPLRVELRPATTANARPGTDELTVQLGNVLNARYLLRRDGGGNGSNGIDVLAGGIGVQQAAPLPAAGVSAAATFDQLDIDAWRAAFAGGSGGSGSNAGSAGAAEPPSPFLPNRIALRARTLHGMGRTLDEVALDASREADGWNAKVDSRQIAGAVQWRPAGPSAAGSLRLRLARLNVPDANDEHNVVDALASSIDTLPAIDLVADQFMLRGHDFGKLEVKAHTDTGAGGADPVWTLDKLQIEQPGATLTGNGSWRVPRRLRADASAERRTLLSFAIDMRDAGATLDRLGLPHTLSDGKGKLEGRVAWRGSPLSIDYPTLTGKLALDLENGQILSVEPGAARLLGVLSLQGLLRFATLDFRTLSGRGLLFDRITGSGTIENGVGTIQDFQLRSPQIIASMSGTANLLRETQDLHVAVVPRINATTTSIAAAFINPALGIGTLAAQLLFADEFSKMFTQHYRISGSWANPQVGKVEDNKAQGPTFQNRADPAFPR